MYSKEITRLVELVFNNYDKFKDVSETVKFLIDLDLQLEKHQLVARDPADSILVSDMDMSTHAKNSLLRTGCKTVEDIIACGIDGLKKKRSIGVKTLNIIVEAVKEYGYEIPEVSSWDF